MLIHNKYYLVILVVDILRQTYSAIINMGIYYMTYVLGKAELLGTFSGAINLALIIGLAFLPALVAKFKGFGAISSVSLKQSYAFVVSTGLFRPLEISVFNLIFDYILEISRSQGCC